MVNTYVEYIDRYLLPEGLDGLREPGEHHFVGVYLVPKLYSMSKIVPDYVNPDGTKSIQGDVVYFKEGKHAIGIEVKLGTIRLTANEFNKWILDPSTSEHPDFFVGVGTKGLIFQSWARFREVYINMVGASWFEGIEPVERGKYGPQRRVNVLIRELMRDKVASGSELFLWTDDAQEISDRETRLNQQLRVVLGHCR